MFDEMLMKKSPLLAGGDSWHGTGSEPVVPAAAVLPQLKSICTKEHEHSPDGKWEKNKIVRKILTKERKLQVNNCR